MVTRIFFITAVLSVLFTASSCAGGIDTPLDDKSTDYMADTLANTLTDSNVGFEAEALEMQAIQFVEKAFSYNVSGIEPVIESYNDLTTLRYPLDDNDFFIVEFCDEFSYPSTLYHFCHLGEDEGVNLAAEEPSDYLSDEMITTAKEFVQKVFGVDCAEAEVHAYGYANKIAVQLELADGVFSVRFYYEEQEPVGVLFHNDADAFGRAMDTMQAKKYF